MKIAANFLVALTAIVCLAALAISVYPGVLIDLLTIGILLSILVVPVLGIVTLVGLIILAYKGKLRGLKIPWTQAGGVFALLFVTFILLVFYVPRRIAFGVSRGAFEQMVPQAKPAKDEWNAAPVNHRLGLYKVEKFASDPRGGVYFRVYTGFDGFGPDEMSYGFAYQPNPQGTPFGAARYGRFRLGNDWYWFRASNDWF